MPGSGINSDDFFLSCFKHAEIDFDGVCQETGLTSNAVKKRWKRFTKKQEAGDGAKPKQPPSTKKGVKRANDDEETLSKKPKKSTEADEEDKEEMLAPEDDVNEEEQIRES